MGDGKKGLQNQIKNTSNHFLKSKKLKHEN
jgi:hypothetical protein